MRVLFLSLFVIIADQFSKLAIKGISIPFLGIDWEGMRYGQSINVIGDFFKITFVENPGMAFGIGVGEIQKLFLSLFSLAAAVGIFIYLYKRREIRLIERSALALIFAGAVGNLIDRMFYGLIYGYAPVFYGKVVDFLNVEFFDFSLFGKTFERFPIFNIADSAVSIGVVLILLFHHKTAETKKETATVSGSGDFLLNRDEPKEAPIAESTGNDGNDIGKSHSS